MQKLIFERRVRLSESMFEALELVRPELSDLSRNELVPPNLDILEVVNIVFKALPGIEAMLPEIADQLPRFDRSQLHRLRLYAAALYAADRECKLRRLRAPNARQLLTPQARQHRAALIATVNSLVGHGLVAPPYLSCANGYANLASDLECLVAVLLEAFPRIHDKCAYTQPELESIRQLALELLREPADTDFGARQNAAIDTRTRVFTLLMRTYSDVRRAVIYLRTPCGDAEAYVPSLYPGRRR